MINVAVLTFPGINGNIHRFTSMSLGRGQDMSKVKMFDFKRFANFGDEWVNPVDVIAVCDVGPYRLVRFDSGSCDTKLTLQEIEDEINRALEATLQAQKDLHSETTGKLEGIIAELKSKLEPTAEDFFKNNDLYPKGEN